MTWESAEDRTSVCCHVSEALAGRFDLDGGRMNGNETMIVFNFYACPYTRPKKPYFRTWPRERSDGTIKTGEEEPHVDCTGSLSSPDAVSLSIKTPQHMHARDMNLMNTKSSIAFASHFFFLRGALSCARDVVEHILPCGWRRRHDCSTRPVSLQALTDLCCWVFHGLAR